MLADLHSLVSLYSHLLFYILPILALCLYSILVGWSVPLEHGNRRNLLYYPHLLHMVGSELKRDKAPQVGRGG